MRIGNTRLAPDAVLLLPPHAVIHPVVAASCLPVAQTLLLCAAEARGLAVSVSDDCG
jgi:hypothetical protein